MKKILLIIIIIFSSITLSITCSTFNINKSTVYITEHSEKKSKCCCAWYVMRALQEGGCYIGIYPAWMYKYILPMYNFDSISIKNYKAKKGDIIVIENSKEHFWGHIAMFNGNQWISDFKQKNMNPYKKNYNYKIYRYNKTNL
jgi:hypothetical protein